MAATSSAAFVLGPPRVNLMPRAEIERREKGRLVTRWTLALVAAIVAVAVTSGVGMWMQWSAEQRLAAADSRTAALLGELADLADVKRAAALESELTDFRAQAMAADIDWPTLVGKIHDVMPAGVVMVGFDLTSGAIPAGNDPNLEIGALGSFTFVSATPVEMAPLIRAARPLPGVLDADGWELTSEEKADVLTYRYVLRVTVDQSIYTGDFAEGTAE